MNLKKEEEERKREKEKVRAVAMVFCFRPPAENEHQEARALMELDEIGIGFG